jgi:hypothetical protein
MVCASRGSIASESMFCNSGSSAGVIRCQFFALSVERKTPLRVPAI